MGSGPRAFVVASISLQCKGKNDSVEHKGLAEKVQDTITALGVQLQDVVAFVSDSGSVLKAAFKHELQPLYSWARHILCSSHTLNGVGSAMVAALPGKVTRIFKLGRAILHAKRQASGHRRWFAHLRSVGLKCIVLPRYIKAQWTIWRHCAEWWMEYARAYTTFLQAEKMGYKVDKVPTTLAELLGLLEATPKGLQAIMTFMIDGTDPLAETINSS